MEILKKKCQVWKIEAALSVLTSDNLKEWNTVAWENQIKPLMKSVPEFHQLWEEWVNRCRDLFDGSN